MKAKAASINKFVLWGCLIPSSEHYNVRSYLWTLPKPYVIVFALGLGLTLTWLMAAVRFSTTQAAPQAPTADVIYVDADASGPTDGLTWSTAYTTLQDGLDAAEAGDEVWVAEGVYTPTNTLDRSATFQLQPGVALYGGFAATETTRAQRDWEAHVTVLSGDLGGDDVTDDQGVVTDSANIVGHNAYHVVSASSVSETAVLDGFTVTGGKANGSFADGCGGGMYNDRNNTSPRVANVIFSGNHGSYGGGMHNAYLSSPTLVDVVFENNTASYGAGLYNAQCSPLLVNVTFQDNAAGIFGGGIYSFSGDLQLVNVTFSQNTSSNRGGGMYDSQNDSRLTNVTFSDNAAEYSGGAMYNYLSDAQLTNCILWGNTAGSLAPQIYNDTSTPVITHTLVQGSGGSGAGWDTSLGSDGGGNIDADPLFTDASNGHLRLQPTSPAINAGDSAALPSDMADLDGDGNLVEPLPLDMAGKARVMVGAVDMGAYEWYPRVFLPLVLRGSN